MLFRLEIENFYSIRDKQVIDLRVAENVPDEAGRLAPIWGGSNVRAPKVVTFFGANASGKSNVLKALSFVVWFVQHSFSHPSGSSLPFERFNDQEMLKSPTRLAVDFAGPAEISRVDDPLVPQCRYSYEFVLSGTTPAYVAAESLHYWPTANSRRTKLFQRDSNGNVTGSKAFGLSGFSKVLHKILRPDTSVISTLAQMEHRFSKFLWQATGFFRSNILVEHQSIPEKLVQDLYSQNPNLVEKFNREVERIDIGIRSMQIQQGSNGLNPVFAHAGLSLPMPMHYESEGTRQFIKIYPMLLNALENGAVTVIDEIDSKIHPMILPEILRWFYSSQRNIKNGQLWVSCHSVSLLEELAKEEVMFCEKDKMGRTRVYALTDIQSVRRADNLYRKYIGGSFGAVPHIG